MSSDLHYRVVDGWLNERRLERDLRKRLMYYGFDFATGESETIVVHITPSGIDMFPYPHYFFPRPLPIELKGVAV